MKKTILFIFGFLVLVSLVWGDGLEDFTNSNATSSYTTNSFVGNNSITWSYVASRNGNGDANGSGISLPALMLRAQSYGSKITSSSIANGIGDFSVKLYKGFTGAGNRQVELFINNNSQGTSTVFDDFDEHVFTVENINITGDIVIEIRDITTKQVIIDDISWTSYAGGGNSFPVVTDVTTDPLNPVSTDAVDVSADITDSDGTITSAKLMWGTDGSTFPNTINMTTSRATYATVSSIPAQTQGTTVYYKVEAIDDEPDTTTTGAYSYKIPYELSIYAIQGGSSASPYDGDEIITDGIVTGVYSSEGYFTIQDSSATWNGIWIKDATAVSRGDDVTIRGTVAEDYSYGDTNNTILKNVTVTINSSGNTLPAVLTINTGDVPTEEYEGVLIKVSNAECTNEDLGYGEWEVNDGSGACKANDLGYAYTPVLGTFYDVTGPLAYSYSDFKIEPRDSNDVVELGDTDPPTISDVVAPNSSTVQVTFSEYVDETTSGNTANYSISSRLVTVNNAVRNSPDSTQVTLTVSGMTEGDYTLTVINVEDLHENAIISENMNFNYTAQPETGDVVINEIGEPYDMPHTWQSSYIELYNTTDESIDISGWIVHSILSSRATSSFTFPEGTTISATGYIIASRERDNFLADYGTYVDENIVPIASATTGTGVYIANGYSFSLETNVGTTLESTSSTVYWNSQVYERAYADSAANDDDNWYLTYQFDPVQGTPGAANSQGAPDAPTDLVITVNGTNIDLNWTAVTGATGYKIYRSTDPYDFNGADEFTSGTNSYEDTGAADGTHPKYFYMVTATN